MSSKNLCIKMKLYCCYNLRVVSSYSIVYSVKGSTLFQTADQEPLAQKSYFFLLILILKFVQHMP